MSRKLAAMSGGVDSAVSLLLAKESGEECEGLTLALAKEGSSGALTDEQNAGDAGSVCRKLGAAHHTLYAYPAFREKVIGYFIREYREGRTPNPCVVCNREIKFGLLADWAAENGFGALVTGHYARLVEDNGFVWLCRAADEGKDQSYMLAMLSQEQLRFARFPLGELTKAEVRLLAEENGFVSAHRKDSQDVCFIPDGDYVKFITEETGDGPVPGNYLDEEGKILGSHRGHLCYTIGQRKGLGISMGRHVFVLSKDASANTVTLGGEPSLFYKKVALGGLRLPSDHRALDGDVPCTAKLRYAHRPAPAVFHRTGEEEGVLEFDEPQRAPAPGQFAVLYGDERVLGAGVIL